MSLPVSMTVIEMREPGGPDVLQSGARPLPVLKDHEILVKVSAAGVNGPDLVQRRGHYPPPKGASDLLGLEVSGEVVAVGATQNFWAVGDKICGLTNGGGYAEYVAIDAAHCLPIPDGISLMDAAGLPETYFTVWSNVFFNHKIPETGNFLVHGGAGGIGSTAIQLGTAMGLSVYTTAADAESCAYCESLGAHRAINFKEEDFVDILREAGGADIILDIIGGDYIARNIKAARHDARMIQLAFNAGSRVEIDLMPVMLKRLSFTGSTLRSRPDQFKADVAADLKAVVWPLFGSDASRLRATTFTSFPLADAGKAHALMESASQHGKILLTI
ncbi:MAG: NAD(P)H-quinone oxidoreductase [Proteobacteria bacterium]|nr:NAD(P)H-quinone oxidoreductase [Pseudomonadota bacterium]MDA0846205.1 NAD(P)H-quinone oxidoreductase [Pseudomonadota bacterium]